MTPSKTRKTELCTFIGRILFFGIFPDVRAQDGPPTNLEANTASNSPMTLAVLPRDATARSPALALDGKVVCHGEFRLVYKDGECIPDAEPEGSFEITGFADIIGTVGRPKQHRRLQSQYAPHFSGSWPGDFARNNSRQRHFKSHTSGLGIPA